MEGVRITPINQTDTLFITPINPLHYQRGVGIIKDTAEPERTLTGSFGNMFRSLIDEAAEAERNYDEQKYLLATGQIEDAHTVPIAGSYAQLTIDMLVNIRNKALEAYNELMRLSI